MRRASLIALGESRSTRASLDPLDWSRDTESRWGGTDVIHATTVATEFWPVPLG